MSADRSRLYLLVPDALDRLAEAGAVGGLVPALSWEEGTTAFQVRDTFDQEIRHSGRLLIETETQIEVLGAEGRSLAQPGVSAARFVAEFAKGPVTSALSDLSPLRCLLPVGAGVLRRGVLALLDDEAKTQARALLLDLCVTEGGAAIVVQLQGLRGYDKALLRLRGMVEAAGGTAFGEQPLYAGLFPGQPDYRPKPQVPIGHDTEAFDAASDIIAAYLPVARANETGVIADHDTEFLHDYRIALRKIRSVLSLFRDVYDTALTDELKTRFSALMVPTGRLRDLDVYLLERERFYGMVPDSLHPGLDRMFALFAEERAAAQKSLAEHLRSPAYRKEITALVKLFGSGRKSGRRKLARGDKAALPAYDFACRLIWKRYRKICAIAEGIDAETPDHEVHELRIHCKKLRYLMEFFAPLFPEAPFKRLIKPLKKLQDNLGLFNDCSVQQDSLQQVLGRLDGATPGDLQAAQSVGALIVVLHGRQLEERARVVGSFAAFNSAATRETFRDLFHGGKE
ncbi:CHAD domain-containing protein [Salipiger mangrovisoli]|uniref:CHAD domain-containing protein n=1 Tax=Salipiger mangrovisoli TaxID=2865933 RepID=A0ABR9X761_9RHOB|nr:CHAD domain-containing protein [Salipiger mangrovisoli]MBE9639450.1 CHAD domain-containing protein [Salipiger mangrovisoli]